MKMLVHREAVSGAAPFRLEDLKLYLRVTHCEEDMLIHGLGMAAAHELEDFAQIALLTQTIRVTIFDPQPQQYSLNLPIGPVATGANVTVLIDGEAFTGFQLEGGRRAYLRWLSPYHELCPDRISIEYQAGFGETAAAIPTDLAHALRDQVCLLYDVRSPSAAKHTSSPHMARIGARHRGVSV